MGPFGNHTTTCLGVNGGFQNCRPDTNIKEIKMAKTLFDFTSNTEEKFLQSEQFWIREAILA